MSLQVLHEFPKISIHYILLDVSHKILSDIASRFDNIQVPVYKQYPVIYDQDVYLIVAYFCEPALRISDNTCYSPNI